MAPIHLEVQNFLFYSKWLFFWNFALDIWIENCTQDPQSLNVVSPMVCGFIQSVHVEDIDTVDKSFVAWEEDQTTVIGKNPHLCDFFVYCWQFWMHIQKLISAEVVNKNFV